MLREPDCVYATQGFTCSFCGGIFPPDEFGIPVVRPLNVKPEWPPEAPRVDLLLCPSCLRAMNVELLAALKTLLNAIPEWTAWDQDDEPDECFEARALIERMERVKP